MLMIVVKSGWPCLLARRGRFLGEQHASISWFQTLIHGTQMLLVLDVCNFQLNCVTYHSDDHPDIKIVLNIVVYIFGSDLFKFFGKS
jgi:hypothetical protein